MLLCFLMVENSFLRYVFQLILQEYNFKICLHPIKFAKLLVFDRLISR